MFKLTKGTCEDLLAGMCYARMTKGETCPVLSLHYSNDTYMFQNRANQVWLRAYASFLHV